MVIRVTYYKRTRGSVGVSWNGCCHMDFMPARFAPTTTARATVQTRSFYGDQCHGACSHQSFGPREIALPSPASAQPRGLVFVGSRCLCQVARGEQADFPEYRLFHLSLVPCDGAR